MRTILILILASIQASLYTTETYAWQETQAEIVPGGDLRWAPRPFAFRAGPTTRYIDFDNGSDDAPGTREQPWRRHPWDPEVAGRSRAHSGPATFIFKRGVVYRGRLSAPAMDGSAGEPSRLTSDPSWGSGDAIVCGAAPVTGWLEERHRDMPTDGAIWSSRIDWQPRRVWIRATDGALQRLTLARTPNWKSAPDDMRAGWWEWENPQWWTGANKVSHAGKRMHIGIDARHLDGPPELYRDALVWTEYAIMMGSPYATRVEGYDAQRKGLIFQGPWWGDGEQTVTGNRYYLEDKPQFLDEDGEYWFEPAGKGGTLYVRLPAGVNPAAITIEAARHSTLVSTGSMHHLEISGLVFQAGNTHWDLTARSFVDPEVESAGIRLLGSGSDIRIANCRFEHLTGGVRLRAPKDDQTLKNATISDCDFADLDRFGIFVGNSSRWGKAEGPFSHVEEISILRNRLTRIGLRGGRDCHGHVIVTEFPASQHIAGNIVAQVGGAGIFAFGGKGSGQLHDVPLSRSLIHHNKVSDTMLMTNDWGGIETWQGGPHYLWSNISVNPGGYWHWSARNMDPRKPESIDYGTARQGYAFYFDGSFKNWVFNNIAIGGSSTIGDPRSNACAFMEVIGFQNAFFNNTAWRFNAGHRRQHPRAGRDLILGNIYQDMSMWNLALTKPRGTEDANAYQMKNGEGKDFNIPSMAIGANVFAGTTRAFGAFDELGTRHGSMAEFAVAFAARKAKRADIGISQDGAVLADPAAGDFRPAASSPAVDSGVRVFVPWSLAATVGEWHFTLNVHDPDSVIDEHWYMTPYYAGREDYWKTPRNHLHGTGLAITDYIAGPLEDWTNGALRLAAGTTLVVPGADRPPYSYSIGKETRTAPADVQASADVSTDDLLIEAYLRTTQRDGSIVAKLGRCGYAFELADGRPRLRLRIDGTDALVATATQALADGAWHHIIVEADRDGAPAIYIDGQAVQVEKSGVMPTASLSDQADLRVGGLAMDIDFLRLARSTLAGSRTSIDELYAWQTNGPHLRDFAGRPPIGSRRDAGALESAR
jgi:hypothetical protein